uniref:Triabin-like lipocalin 2 n=1 Tax=Rhodnius prolixus TaxID=13249 RepID=Q7YT05_RHOPR|nr:triabin-like lipocalin 2 precursor [Rhodnius prolixus]
MNRIILITIFGILTLRSIHCITNGECDAVTAQENIDEFFTGTWYVTHSKGGARASLCDQFATSSDSGGTKLIKYSLKEDGSYGTHCEGKPSNKDNPYPYNCELKSSFLNIPAKFTVVSADNNAAVLYKCTKPTTRSADDYFILNRQKDAEIPEEVQSTLTSLKLTSSSFTSSKDTCT